MKQETGATVARGLWPALAACLLDFEAFPGRYPLALREPRLLFDHGTEVLTLACDRAAEGLPQDEALEAQLRQAARFFVRTAMLRPGADHYTLLGLTPVDEPGKLRDHYRMLMRLTHPDFSGGGRAWPADAATRINQANDVLSSAVSRQEYDRTLGVRQPLRPSEPGPTPMRGRPSAPGHRPRPVSTARRRAVMGALVVAGVLVLGAWLFSGTGEHDQADQRELVAAAPTGRDQQAPLTPATPELPAGAGDNSETATTGGAPAVAQVDPPVQAEPRLALRASQGLEGFHGRPKGAPAAVAAPGPVLINAPAPVASPPSAPQGVAPSPLVGAGPTAPVPAPVGATATPASPGEAPVVAARLSMDDVQPLLGHVLGALQSGRGEQVLRWVERPIRPGDGAEGFVQTYNRAVGNARAVRVGAVRFDGRPAAEGLQVEGVVLLHVQDENQQAATRELVLHAQFASKGGQAVLTRLNASETLR